MTQEKLYDRSRSSNREVRIKVIEPFPPEIRLRWDIIVVGEFSYLLSAGIEHGVPQIKIIERTEPRKDEENIRKSK